MKVASRTDLYVGIFVVATIGIIVAALVATSGWGIRHFYIYLRSNDARDVAVDTRIYLQGLEVGRVASISPRPTAKRGVMEFIIQAQMVAQFKSGDSLQLPGNVEAEVEPLLLGGALLTLNVYPDDEAQASGCQARSGRTLLQAGDTICMHRRPGAMEAFGNLATDLKGGIADAIVSANHMLVAYQRLADSLSHVTGQASGLVQGIRPGAESTLTELTASLSRLRRMLDTADIRSGSTLAELNLTMQQTRATLEQSRIMLVSADSLTRLLLAMGAENRPELRAMLLDARFMTQQLLYVTEQLSRRPMRAMSGVELPESLTVEGRARRVHADSAKAQTTPPRDSSRGP